MLSINLLKFKLLKYKQLNEITSQVDKKLIGKLFGIYLLVVSCKLFYEYFFQVVLY